MIELQHAICMCAQEQATWKTLYQFHDSLPASEAKLEDFLVGHKTIDTDMILLPNTEKTFYIDLRLVTYSQAEEAAKKPQKKLQKKPQKSHK